MRRTIWAGIALCIGATLAAVCAASLIASVFAAPTSPDDILTVCKGGSCSYADIQPAVDAAPSGSTIKVAAGVYNTLVVRPRADVETTGNVTQVVYISKTLIIRGGYTTTNGMADPPDPVAHPTILDAGSQGRVIYITGPDERRGLVDQPVAGGIAPAEWRWNQPRWIVCLQRWRRSVCISCQYHAQPMLGYQ
jgi:hypothetical protein